jgi:hypothetical protein
MNTKKFVLAFILVFVLVEITNYIIHMAILGPVYASDEVKVLFRTQEEMMDKLWIMYILDLVWSFFFVFFFVKGYENKGIFEGLRFGLYIALFFYLVSVYGQYTVYPIPYYLALQWFLYGLVQALILGAAAALVYKPKAAADLKPATV